ncbi:MAG: thioredoxin family protein [Saprospiraceae bacterium]|nr:thioredoxin family protein [Saprospiraceae bacterium]
MHRILLLFVSIFIGFNSCSKTEDIGSLENIQSLDEFKGIISSGVSLIFFHASWCPNCQEQRPAIEALTKRDDLKAAKIYQVDYEKIKEVVNEYNIIGFPTIVFYKNNVEVKRFESKGHSEEELANILKGLL